MKNATRVRLESSTSVSLLDARLTTHLRLEDWRLVRKLAVLESCAVVILALCYIVCVGFGWFVGLSQSDINWSTIWSTYMLQCNEPSTWQLSNFGSLT